MVQKPFFLHFYIKINFYGQIKKHFLLFDGEKKDLKKDIFALFYKHFFILYKNCSTCGCYSAFNPRSFWPESSKLSNRFLKKSEARSKLDNKISFFCIFWYAIHKNGTKERIKKEKGIYVAFLVSEKKCFHVLVKIILFCSFLW